MPRKKAAKKRTKKKPEQEFKKNLAILSADPGKNCGASLFVEGELIATWKCLQSVEKVAGYIHALHQKAKSLGLKPLLIVENQFVHKDKSNPKTMADLYRRRYEWEIIAELRRVEYQVIYPASWQSILKLSRCRKGTTKDRSIALARTMWPNMDFNEHSADAACMGYWYTKKQEEHFPGIFL